MKTLKSKLVSDVNQWAWDTCFRSGRIKTEAWLKAWRGIMAPVGITLGNTTELLTEDVHRRRS